MLTDKKEERGNGDKKIHKGRMRNCELKEKLKS